MSHCLCCYRTKRIEQLAESTMADCPTNFNSIRIKEEPLDSDKCEAETSAQTSEPTHSSASTAQFAHILKYTRMEAHHRSRGYDVPQNSCEVCQGEFGDQSNLIQHKLLHFNTSHVCYLCDCYFVSTSTMVMHMSTIHRTHNPSYLSGKGDSERAFVCSICLQRFSSNKMLQQHQTNHKLQEDNFFGCKVCGLNFVGYRALMAHLNGTRHKEMKIKIQSIFVCVDCRSIFASRDSYAMHMMMRAQNESCSMVNTNAALPTTTPSINLEPLIQARTNAMAQILKSEAMESRELYALKQESSGSPLNLTIEKTTPVEKELNGDSPLAENVHAEKHKCTKCGVIFNTDGAFAMHIMLHVKEEGENWNKYTPVSSTTVPQRNVNNIGHIPGSGSLSAPLPLYSGSVPSETYSRSTSAPVMLEQQTGKYKLWICHICYNKFDTCDTLAMHVMDTHANEDSGLQSRETALSQKNLWVDNSPQEKNLPEKQCKDSRTNSKQNGTIKDKSIKNFATISSKSSPTKLTRKRCNSAIQVSSVQMTEVPNPKRCHSEGSNSTFDCIFCSEIFSTKLQLDRHCIDRHGVGGITPECQACEMAFLHHQALKKHIQSKEHELQMQRADFLCRICGFALCSEKHLKYHQGYHPRENSQESMTLVPMPKEKNSTNVFLNQQCSIDPLVPDGNRDAQLLFGKFTSASANGAYATPGQISPRNSTFRKLRRKPETCDFFPHEGVQESEPLENRTDWHGTSTGDVPKQDTCPRGQSKSPASVMANCTSDSVQRPTTTTPAEGELQVMHIPPDDENDGDLIDYVLSNANKLSMCKYCKIIYTDQTTYYLHMGLHNVNNPWQCNLCGRVCGNVHEFSSHVIHY